MDERSSLGTVSKHRCFLQNARARNNHFEATLNLSFAAQANNVHYDNASFLLLVYDVTSQASFESCGKWLQQVRKGRSRGAAVPGVLVANKKDLAQSGRRCVTKEKGVEFAEANGLAYFETSALEGEHEEPFRHIAEEFAKKYEDTVARAEEN